MRSYQEYCGLARGLDLVGDRWTLLVVRELAIGDRRYSDLHRTLHGIPTNLLADRLQSLVSNGVIEESEAGGYALTARGRDLVPVLHGFVRWATPDMLSGPTPTDREDPRWVAFAASAFLRSAPNDLAVTMRLVCNGTHVDVRARDGSVGVALDEAGSGDDSPAEVTATANAWALMGLVSAELRLDQLTVVDHSATVSGSRAARRRVGALVDHNRLVSRIST